MRAGAPRRAELLALAAGLATFVYVGWDGALWDARYQLLLHLFGLGAAAGLALMAWRGAALPRTRVDIPILLVVAAFALATLTAENTGLAARALASIVAFACMLPVALVALRARPQWVAFVAIGPILTYSAATLAVMVWRRIGWLAVDGPTVIPPIRIGGEGDPFGSIATPPFMLLAAAPLTLLIVNPRLRRWVQVAMLVVGAPLALLSGSRSAWVAIAVTGIALAAGSLRRVRLPRRWTPRSIALGWLGVLAAVGTVVIGAPRLLAFGSVAYRIDLWRDTLTAWSADPLMGIGPGTMPYARQAAAAALSFPARQPHSHNLPLGLLGDAGLVGLGAGLLLVVAFGWFAGPWRARTSLGRVAACVLLGLGVSGLFEDLTFLPDYNLLLILLAALALADAGAVTWAPISRRVLRPLGAALAVGMVALAVPWLAGDAAGISYRGAMDRAEWSDWRGSLAGLRRAELLDPWEPATPKALAVVADAAGDPSLAMRAARRSVELNPGDGKSWTNLAVLCLQAGDGTCATTAAMQAVARADPFDVEFANAAIIMDRLGSAPRADELYRLSLLTNVQTGFILPWPRTVHPGSAPMPLLDPVNGQLNLLVALRLAGDPIVPTDYSAPAVRALAFQMVGDPDAAATAIAAAERGAPYDALTWDLASVLAYVRGEDLGRPMSIDAAIRGSRIAPPNIPSSTDPPALSYDIGSFHIYPRDALVAGAIRLRGPISFPWSLAPLLAPDFRPAAGGG